MNSIFDQIANDIAENAYAVADQFLDSQEVNNILDTQDFQDWLTHFKKAGIGKDHGHQINESIRGDYIQWIDNNSASAAIGIFLTRLQHLMTHINQNLFLSLKDYEIHMTAYPAGASYKRHLDQFNRDDHRKLSVICYLNKDWLPEYGGQLRMFLPGKPVELLPVSGRFICFRSDIIEHEVLPATRPRLSITGWILDQFVSLKHL